MALVHTPPTTHGTACHAFQLPGTSGEQKNKDQSFGKNGLLVMFICNHCPYVQAIEDRLIQLALDLVQIGIQTVAISSNDADVYPEDSFEKMRERAEKKKYPFPYLYDETQEVAKTFGAVCTPDFFLYDQKQKLFYRGRLDDSWKDPQLVTRRELFEAAVAMTKGLVAPVEFSSMGCSMKWKGPKK